jgi:hypothetical protein
MGIELDRNIYVSDDGLALYVEDIQAIVVADLHIGLEQALMEEGTYLPLNQYSQMKKTILELCDKYAPTQVIINGDFKHEFSRALAQESYEILDLIDSLRDININLQIVRGNHDNYLIRVLKRRGININDPYYKVGRYFFTHGHEAVQIPTNVECVMVAHEHPALLLRDETGYRHKFKCFLIGAWKDKNVTVLPAFSTLSTGYGVGAISQHQVLSKLLQYMDLSKFRPVVIDKGELFNFPTLTELEKIDALSVISTVPDL